jgi:dihydroflavonol-4-reductase
MVTKLCGIDYEIITELICHCEHFDTLSVNSAKQSPGSRIDLFDAGTLLNRRLPRAELHRPRNDMDSPSNHSHRQVFELSLFMIAVTGASGLLGGNLVRELLAQGCRVRALIHQDERAISNLDLEIVRADLADPSSLERAFAGVDVVYHLASLISLRMDAWDEVHQVNVIGTRNVVDACLRGGVRRLVHVSSTHSRQPEPFDQPLDENRPLITDTTLPPYDRSKALGEMEIQKGIERGLDSVILLPSAIVGPFDFRPSFVGDGLQLMQRGGLPALTAGGYNWVDARDVAAGAICAANVASAGSRYILSGHWLSIRDVAVMAAQIGGTRAPRIVLPLWLAELALPIMEKLATLRGSQPLYTRVMLNALRSNQFITHARATRDLGYAPRPFHETLTDTLAWFSQQKAPYES